MGGHISKKHKGMSASYNKKMETRDVNAQRRKQRAMAKTLILCAIGRDCDRRHRVFITQLTKLLLLASKTTDEVALSELHEKKTKIINKIKKAHNVE